MVWTCAEKRECIHWIKDADTEAARWDKKRKITVNIHGCCERRHAEEDIIGYFLL